VTTIEDCYSPDKFPGVEVAEEIYGQTLEWIIDAGVDVIIFETMGNIDEISCGLKMVKKHNIPLWLSMIAKDKYHLLDGSPFSDVFQLLDGYNVETLLTNCNKIDLSIYICDQIISDWRGKWGVYPNLGIEDYENDYFNIISDSKLKDSIKTLLLKKPDLIGLCCGSTPSHLQNLKHMINSTR
jgi:homocysteine S-methyltransferase